MTPVAGIIRLTAVVCVVVAAVVVDAFVAVDVEDGTIISPSRVDELVVLNPSSKLT